MTILYAILIFLVGLLLFNWILGIYGRYGMVVDINYIQHNIKGVSGGGGNGCRLRIKFPEKGTFLEFRKTISKPHGANFFLIFERKNISEQDFDLAKSILENPKLTLSIQIEDSDTDSFRVEFGQDHEKATLVAKLLLRELWGVTESSVLRAGVVGPADARQGAAHGW